MDLNRRWVMRLAAVVAWLSTLPVYGQRYAVVVLEPPPNHVYSVATDLNNAGQVVGYAASPFSDPPLLWDADGTPTVLPLLPDPDPERSVGFARGINNLGQVCGDTNTRVAALRAALWPQPDTIVGIHDWQPANSIATDINDNGVVIGSYYDDVSMLYAYQWESGVTTILWPPMNLALGINNSGQIVGTRRDTAHAVLWENGQTTELPGGLGSGANDINDQGRIAGYIAPDPDHIYPVYWEGGQVHLLARLNSRHGGTAQGLNESGDLVGYNTVSPGEHMGVIWRNNLMSVLDDLVVGADGWTVNNAQAINESGQIAGSGYNDQLGVSRALRLDPVDSGLTLWGIAPGAPGRRNVLRVNHATPSGRVYLIWGTERGDPRPLVQCPGAVIDIADPHLATSVIARSDGRAYVAVDIPAGARGRRLILQVIDRESCEVSPPAWLQLQEQ